MQTKAEQTVKRYLKRIASKPVDVFPGYLCNKNAIVFFMVFDRQTERFLFEISIGTNGKLLYTKKHKFENPPLFADLFKASQQIHEQKIADIKKTKPYDSEVRINLAQTIILDKLAEHNIKLY